MLAICLWFEYFSVKITILNDLEEIKEEITSLVLTGKKEEAIVLIQKKYGANRAEAEKLLALAFKESVQPIDLVKRIPQILSGGKGCKKTIYGMLAFGFGFFGIPMLLGAIGIGIYFNYEEKHSLPVEGTVIDHDTYKDGNGTIQYTPIVSYTVKGEQYSCKGTMYSSPPEYQIGDVLPVFVNPAEPHSAFINTYSERWFVITFLGVGSIMLIILMLIFTFMSRRL